MRCLNARGDRRCLSHLFLDDDRQAGGLLTRGNPSTFNLRVRSGNCAADRFNGRTRQRIALALWFEPTGRLGSVQGSINASSCGELCARAWRPDKSVPEICFRNDRVLARRLFLDGLPHSALAHARVRDFLRCSLPPTRPQGVSTTAWQPLGSGNATGSH